MPKICSVEGCESSAHGRGLCNKHYLRAKFSDPNRPRCSVNGCSKPVKARGLCAMHYARKINTGTTKANFKLRDGNAQKYYREHTSWACAKARCYYKGHQAFGLYGGRGIKMCDRWLGPYGFEKFLEDMGPRPDGCTLDRIDPDGDYCPENCRWADVYTQAANKVGHSNTGIVGVFYVKNQRKWRAHIRKKGVAIQKNFSSKEEAIKYRKQLELWVLTDDEKFLSVGVEI